MLHTNSPPDHKKINFYYTYLFCCGFYIYYRSRQANAWQNQWRTSNDNGENCPMNIGRRSANPATAVPKAPHTGSTSVRPWRITGKTSPIAHIKTYLWMNTWGGRRTITQSEIIWVNVQERKIGDTGDRRVEVLDSRPDWPQEVCCWGRKMTIFSMSIASICPIEFIRFTKGRRRMDWETLLKCNGRV